MTVICLHVPKKKMKGMNLMNETLPQIQVSLAFVYSLAA